MRTISAAVLRTALRTWRKHELLRFTTANWLSFPIYIVLQTLSVEEWGLNYVIGSIIGFIGYLIFQFLLMLVLVYRERRDRESHIARQFLHFSLMHIATHTVHVLCLWVGVHVLVWGWGAWRFNYLLAEGPANAVSFYLNRIGSNRILAT